MTIKISVIVPVYNARVYLDRCLDSLIKQTLEEIEIIIINDCSTDRGIEIMDHYQKTYPDKIRLIHLEKNRGPGGARNVGLSIAKGEYIGFVDSDDYVDHSMYEQLYHIAKEGNYDMVDCGFHNMKAKQCALSTTIHSWGNLNLEKRRLLVAYPGFIWSKIIRHSILTDHHLLFRENVAFEDMDFLPIVFLHLTRVYATNLVLYHYTNNTKSITSTGESRIQVGARMSALRILFGTFKTYGIFNDYKDELAFTVYHSYVYMLKYYTLCVENQFLTYDMFKELHDFFFELVDYPYMENQYICSLEKKKRMYAELNNYNYKTILDTILTSKPNNKEVLK